MTRLQIWMPVAICIVTFTFGFAYALRASPQSTQQDNSPGPPKSLTFSVQHPAVEMGTGYRDHEYRLIKIREEDGKAFTTTLTVYGVRRIDSETRESYIMRYGTLVEGDIVPMFTALYRVANIDAQKNTITVQCIDDPELLKQIGVASTSYALPLQTGVRLQDVDLGVKSLAVDNAGEPRARVGGSYTVPTNTIIWNEIALDFPNLRAGDQIKVKDARYKVRKIVLPDQKRQIVGWVELLPIRDNDKKKQDSVK